MKRFSPFSFPVSFPARCRRLAGGFLLSYVLALDPGLSQEEVEGEAPPIDVIEIDGASNRGIDEIRILRENVKTAMLKNIELKAFF